MQVRTKLPKRLETELANSFHLLRDFIDEQRMMFEGMSERWQESDNAAALANWLDELDEVADTLENFEVSAF